MGQVTRIGLVTTVLEPIVLPDRRGVGQMDHETGRLWAVDEPVPVVRGFDHHAGQFDLPRGKDRQASHEGGQALSKPRHLSTTGPASDRSPPRLKTRSAR
jgi:hypothetical protein